MILQLGQSLRTALPAGEPPIAVHGRDLAPDREGVGFQFQYTLNSPLYGGRYRAAYYVVQARLIRRKTSVAWQVDAMPVLERGAERYDLFATRTFVSAFHDRAALCGLFTSRLAADASAFFEAVRAGDELTEASTSYDGVAASA